MKNILLFFGGKSCEHDISVITAQQALDAIDVTRYNVVPVYIDRSGRFKTADCKRLSLFAEGRVRMRDCYLVPAEGCLTVRGLTRRMVDAYCALVCNHGLGGEDGSLQGYLELAAIPYTGCGVTASGAGMDKIIMKKLFKGFGVPCVKFEYCTFDEYNANKDYFIRAAERLSYPLVVKPSNLGSSIGISLVKNREDLEQAMTVAFCYDSRVLVEKAVENLREINCSVIRRGGEVVASPLEEPLSWHSLLTFEDKYLSGGKDGMAGLKRKLPAEIDEGQAKKVRELSEKIYKAFNCRGVVRIDYLVDRDDGKVYANEINTIPGALSYYLWEFGGIGFTELCDILIEEAVEEKKRKDSLTYSYASGVLAGKGMVLK